MPIEMTEYARKLLDDLPEQFKDKPRIEILNKAIGRQLQEVWNFFEQLRTLRSIDHAVGKQLDGIGDIVQLSRTDAMGYGAQDMDDETYRDYLYYKIFKNTSTATYYDIMKSFQMSGKPVLYYAEDPEKPATMVLTTEELPGSFDVERLLNMPIIRGAGIGIDITVVTSTEMETTVLYMGSYLGKGYSSHKLPELSPPWDGSMTEYFSTFWQGPYSAHKLPELLPPWDGAMNEYCTTSRQGTYSTHKLPEI